MKNEQSNTAEKGMAHDRLLCPVIGVVTPYTRTFEQWKKDIGYQTYGRDANFVKLSRKEEVWGRSYYTVEKGYKYDEVDSDVFDAAVLRVR